MNKRKRTFPLLKTAGLLPMASAAKRPCLGDAPSQTDGQGRPPEKYLSRSFDLSLNMFFTGFYLRGLLRFFIQYLLPLISKQGVYMEPSGLENLAKIIDDFLRCEWDKGNITFLHSGVCLSTAVDTPAEQWVFKPGLRRNKKAVKPRLLAEVKLTGQGKAKFGTKMGQKGSNLINVLATCKTMNTDSAAAGGSVEGSQLSDVMKCLQSGKGNPSGTDEESQTCTHLWDETQRREPSTQTESRADHKDWDNCASFKGCSMQSSMMTFDFSSSSHREADEEKKVEVQTAAAEIPSKNMMNRQTDEKAVAWEEKIVKKLPDDKAISPEQSARNWPLSTLKQWLGLPATENHEQNGPQQVNCVGLVNNNLPMKTIGHGQILQEGNCTKQVDCVGFANNNLPMKTIGHGQILQEGNCPKQVDCLQSVNNNCLPMKTIGQGHCPPQADFVQSVNNNCFPMKTAGHGQSLEAGNCPQQINYDQSVNNNRFPVNTVGHGQSLQERNCSHGQSLQEGNCAKQSVQSIDNNCLPMNTMGHGQSPAESSEHHTHCTVPPRHGPGPAGIPRWPRPGPSPLIRTGVQQGMGTSLPRAGYTPQQSPLRPLPPRVIRAPASLGRFPGPVRNGTVVRPCRNVMLLPEQRRPTTAPADNLVRVAPFNVIPVRPASANVSPGPCNPRDPRLGKIRPDPSGASPVLKPGEENPASFSTTGQTASSLTAAPSSDHCGETKRSGMTPMLDSGRPVSGFQTSLSAGSDRVSSEKEGEAMNIVDESRPLQHKESDLQSSHSNLPFLDEIPLPAQQPPVGNKLQRPASQSAHKGDNPEQRNYERTERGCQSVCTLQPDACSHRGHVPSLDEIPLPDDLAPGSSVQSGPLKANALSENPTFRQNRARSSSLESTQSAHSGKDADSESSNSVSNSSSPQQGSLATHGFSGRIPSLEEIPLPDDSIHRPSVETENDSETESQGTETAQTTADVQEVSGEHSHNDRELTTLGGDHSATREQAKADDGSDATRGQIQTLAGRIKMMLGQLTQTSVGLTDSPSSQGSGSPDSTHTPEAVSADRKVSKDRVSPHDSHCTVEDKQISPHDSRCAAEDKGISPHDSQCATEDTRCPSSHPEICKSSLKPHGSTRFSPYAARNYKSPARKGADLYPHNDVSTMLQALIRRELPQIVNNCGSLPDRTIKEHCSKLITRCVSASLKVEKRRNKGTVTRPVSTRNACTMTFRSERINRRVMTDVIQFTESSTITDIIGRREMTTETDNCWKREAWTLTRHFKPSLSLPLPSLHQPPNTLPAGVKNNWSMATKAGQVNRRVTTDTVGMTESGTLTDAIALRETCTETDSCRTKEASTVTARRRSIFSRSSQTAQILVAEVGTEPLSPMHVVERTVMTEKADHDKETMTTDTAGIITPQHPHVTPRHPHPLMPDLLKHPEQVVKKAPGEEPVEQPCTALAVRDTGGMSSSRPNTKEGVEHLGEVRGSSGGDQGTVKITIRVKVAKGSNISLAS